EGGAAAVGGDEVVLGVVDPGLELPGVVGQRGPVRGGGDAVDEAARAVDVVDAAAAHPSPDGVVAPGNGVEPKAVEGGAGVERPRPVRHVAAVVQARATAALGRVGGVVDGGAGPEPAVEAPG